MRSCVSALHNAVARPKWDAYEHLLAEREAEARASHAAVHCLSAAYAVCKTKAGGLGGSPKKRMLLMFRLPPRALC